MKSPFLWVYGKFLCRCWKQVLHIIYNSRISPKAFAHLQNNCSNSENTSRLLARSHFFKKCIFVCTGNINLGTDYTHSNDIKWCLCFRTSTESIWMPLLHHLGKPVSPKIMALRFGVHVQLMIFIKELTEVMYQKSIWRELTLFFIYVHAHF